MSTITEEIGLTFKGTLQAAHAYIGVCSCGKAEVVMGNHTYEAARVALERRGWRHGGFNAGWFCPACVKSGRAQWFIRAAEVELDKRQRGV